VRPQLGGSQRSVIRHSCWQKSRHARSQ
jgi:hypothetical protein